MKKLKIFLGTLLIVVSLICNFLIVSDTEAATPDAPLDINLLMKKSKTELKTQLDTVMENHNTLQKELTRLQDELATLPDIAPYDPTQLKKEIIDQEKKLKKLENYQIIPLRIALSTKQGINLTKVTQVGSEGIVGPDRNAATFLERLINWLAGFTGFGSFILLIAAGIKFIIAAGNETDIGNAKQMFEYAIYGLGVSLTAYAGPSVVRAVLYNIA